MSRPLRWTLPLLLGSASSCVIQPEADREVANTTTPVRFSGFTFAPRQVVSLRSSPTPEGPFTEFATATTSALPLVLSNGDRLHGWTTLTLVEGWSGSPCDARDVYVRAYAGPFASQVYDDASAAVCIAEEVAAGSSTLVAMATCASDQSPDIHLSTPGNDGPTYFVGDVTIATEADQDAWMCLQTLKGNLFVPDSELPTITLPNLESISGGATLVYSRLTDDFLAPTREILLPQLTSVGGSLFLESPAPAPSQVVDMQIGLEAVTWIGGDIEVTVDAFNTDLDGLDALSSMSGHLLVVTGNGDTTMGGFLESLVSVGSVYLDLGNTNLGILEDLQNVDGDFALVDGNPVMTGMASDSFFALSSVGGDFLVENATFNGPPDAPIFDSLAVVGGTLTYRNNAGRPALAFGAPALAVGALEIDANPALVSVGGSNIAVSPTGPVSFTDNPNLCASRVDAFTDALAGWTGISTNTGNDDGC